MLLRTTQAFRLQPSLKLLKYNSLQKMVRRSRLLAFNSVLKHEIMTVFFTFGLSSFVYLCIKEGINAYAITPADYYMAYMILWLQMFD